MNKTVYAGTAFLLTILALALLSSFASASISSSEAQAKVAPVLGSEANEVLSLLKPVEAGSARYWVFFYSIYSSKRVLAAVDDDTGELVTDEDRLKTIGKAVYEYGVVQEYVKKNGWGFDAVEPIMTSIINALTENQRKLTDLTGSVEQRYPTLSFRVVEVNLNSLNEQATNLETMFQDGTSLETIFDNEYVDSELYQLIMQYNTSLSMLNDFSNSYDEYRTSISEVQSQAYKANITDPDYTSINTNLENLRKIGFDQLYENLKKEKPLAEFNRLLSAERENTWITDGIASFTFKKNYYDANEAYNAQKTPVEQTIAAESTLAQCGITISQLKKDWNEIKYFMSKGSSASYAKVNEKMPSITAQVQDAQDKYEACLNPPRSRGTTKVVGVDAGTAVAALFIIAIAATGYWYWKKKREEEAY
ncbi:hypothetical protein H0N96_02620 [Candidatus Micrarchaeota archaeon]|nr:hypothetical protein [Candidatus Micrarchaeota archaeon]